LTAAPAKAKVGTSNAAVAAPAKKSLFIGAAMALFYRIRESV